MSSNNESRSDQVGELVDQFSKSNKSTIAGFLYKFEGKDYASFKPDTFSHVAWKSFTKNILKMGHGMRDVEIESTFSNFLEIWLVLTDEPFQVPLRFRDDVTEKALTFFQEQGYEAEESKQMCKEWRKRQADMDKSKSTSSSSAEGATKKPTMKNPLAKLQCLGPGELSMAIPDADTVNEDLSRLGDRVNIHYQAVARALIAALSTWEKDTSIAVAGITSYQSLKSAEIALEATELERALNIAPTVRVLMKIMKEAFADEHDTHSREHVRRFHNFTAGHSGEFESTLKNYIELMKCMKLVEDGKGYTEQTYVNQFITGLQRSHDSIMKEIGYEMDCDDNHRGSLIEASNFIRKKIKAKRDISKQRNDYNHKGGKGKGGKGGKGKGGKGKGKGKGGKGKGGKGNFDRGNNKRNWSDEGDQDVNAMAAVQLKKQQTNQRNNNNAVVNSWINNVLCYKCGGKGHMKHQCPQKGQEFSNMATIINQLQQGQKEMAAQMAAMQAANSQGGGFTN
jgi:hypothetical protein